MALTIAILAYGEDRYLREAQESIAWHRRHGMKNAIQLWVQSHNGPTHLDADIRHLPAIASSSPAFVVGWYYKTQVLRELCENTSEPFCLLDSYARVLSPAIFDQTAELARRFSVCLSLDPRRTLARELRQGRGISPEVADDVRHIPETFPLWNTGVIFAAPSDESRKLFGELETICRGYLDRGLSFREQIALVKAVWQTGIKPLTLPDNYNVRRPYIDPAVVLHTRRFGHFYGMEEVDTPSDSWERWRHRLKSAVANTFGLRSLFSG